MKSKRIDLYFKSNKRETNRVDENKTKTELIFKELEAMSLILILCNVIYNNILKYENIQSVKKNRKTYLKWISYQIQLYKF